MKKRVTNSNLNLRNNQKIHINIMFSGPGNTGKSTAVNGLIKLFEDEGFDVKLHNEIARNNFDVLRKKGLKIFQEKIFIEENKRIENLLEKKKKSVKYLNNLIRNSGEIMKINGGKGNEIKKITSKKLIELIGKNNIQINVIDRCILDCLVYYNFNLFYNSLEPSELIQFNTIYKDFSIVGYVYDYKILFRTPIKSTTTKEFQMYNDERLIKLFRLEADQIKKYTDEIYFNINKKSKNKELIDINYINKINRVNEDYIGINNHSGVAMLENNIEFENKKMNYMILDAVKNLTVLDYIIKNQIKK